MYTKKFIYILVLVVTICISLFGGSALGGNKLKMNNKTDNYADIFEQYKVPKNYMPKDGIINDEKTASKIAKEILVSLYGDSVKDTMPFKVDFDEKYQVWVIKGILDKNKIGGVPNIIINKTDGKVLAVWHTK